MKDIMIPLFQDISGIVYLVSDSEGWNSDLSILLLFELIK
jgi:hypothetical protein